MYTPLERFYWSLLDPLGPFQSALDVGCGNGQKLVALASEARIASGTGIDISRGALEGATRLKEQFGTARLTFERMPLEDYEAESRHDLVLALQVVNYLRDPGELFERAREWILPGGVLLVSDARRPAPLANRLRRRWRRIRGLEQVDDGLTYHDPEVVLASACAAGFVLESRRSSCHLLGSVIVTFTYEAEHRRFRTVRLWHVVRWIHSLLTALWRVEDRLTPGRGALYGLVLRAGDRAALDSLRDSADGSGHHSGGS